MLTPIDREGAKSPGHPRAMTFILLFIALFLGYILLPGSQWQGSSLPETVLLALVSLLGLTVGVVGMVRFYGLLSALERAKAAAEEANRTKSRFVANASHEIRSPLYVITGMTGLALKTCLTDDQRECLEAVQSASDTLLKVINDILDFSKMEAGRLDLDEVTFDLGGVIDTTLKPMAARAHEKRLDLVCGVGWDVPHVLVGDPERLRQVLVNLVDNAIKFTERGEVALRVDTVARTHDGVRLHFSVADTGVGIPPEKREHVFEPFAQVDSLMDKGHGGAGLGLAISRQLVGMMGGRLWVESGPGDGSTFHWTARFGVRDSSSVVPEVRAAQAGVPGPRGLRVLLAEDNGMSQVVTRRMLEQMGHDVTVVDNGLAVLAILEALEEQSFDLVLMDVRLPRMDGLEATSLVRRREAETAGHLPIIGVTAYATSETGERCLSAGMDGHLFKPLAPADLSAAIDRALGA